MSLELELLLKRDPKNGIVGIDLRTVPLVTGPKALCEAGSARLVVFVIV